MANLLRTHLQAGDAGPGSWRPTLPAVSADPTQIRQIVMNLITNASDAMGEAPGRSRSGPACSAGEIAERIGRRAARASVYLEIGDTGSAWTPETRAHLRSVLLHQVHRPRAGSRRRDGNRAGATRAIRIRTEPGKGTSFGFSYPGAGGAAHVEHRRRRAEWVAREAERSS